MFKYLLNRLVNYLLSLLDKDKLQELKDTNQEVYQEIKETPSLLGKIQVGINSTIDPESNKQKSDHSNIKIIERFLPPSQYVQDSTFKVNQVVLHHTAGGTAQSTIDYWLSNKERVCTTFIIDRDGSIFQCLPLEKCWGYHLYVGFSGNKIDRNYKKLSSKYDAQSIGIEICNYGFLTKQGDSFINYVGKTISKDKVTKLDTPYKEYLYWEKYTDKQIESVEKLLLFLLSEYPILKTGLKTDYSTFGSIDKDALDLKPGIYSHVNFRTDKFDTYPDSDLINMLNKLHTKI